MVQSPTMAVAGSLAQRHRHGGHAWVFLQYLLGFRRLGFDVIFLDRLEPGMCVDENGQPAPFGRSANLGYLRQVMDRHGLGDCWALAYDGGRQWAGVDAPEVERRLRSCELLIDVMGFMAGQPLTEVAPVRAFLDIDPGFGQMWQALGLHDPFPGYDHHITIGENIGSPKCTIPTCGIDWITTKQPVVLDQWPVTGGAGDRFTSIGAWRGPYGPIEYGGRTYGLRVHEFRRFVDLPRLTGVPFEIALSIDDSDANDRHLLAEAGWTVVDPDAVAADPWQYRQYIQSSAAEFMVAKNIYVQSRSGWFSDRSICYLASGRPVLAQDTGLAGVVPSGDGLVTFTTIEEAAEGVALITGDYRHHSAAARAVAKEHFDSDRVLRALLERLGVKLP